MPHSATYLSKLLLISESVGEQEFKENLFALLSTVTSIAHYAIHVFDIDRLDEPSLALVSGDITEHYAALRTRRSAEYAKARQVIFDELLAQLAERRSEPGELIRFRPDENMGVEYAIFKEGGILEKIYDVRIRGRKLYQLSLYRRSTDGPFAESEVALLGQVVPIAMNLSLIHFHLRGGDRWQKRNERRLVSSIRSTGVPAFAGLTEQETRVCDLIVYGLTTEGIAAEMEIGVSSVKTYRHRAYRKLDIGTKSELFAMIIHNIIGTQS